MSYKPGGPEERCFFDSPPGGSTRELKGTMLVHTVVFWLRQDITAAQREAFNHEGLASLRAISSVSQLFVGRPAPIPSRPVVDATYDFAITVLFNDLAAHDAYQVDPVHTAFVARFKADWVRVQIYDAQ